MKKDETIIDFAYCISDSQRNHCIWMLDEKFQVWKCTNEVNPSSCNWTLTKTTIFDTLIQKKFLQPAMTYDDFYMTTILNKLKCLRENVVRDRV